LKRILDDPKFQLNDEIEEITAKMWNGVTFDSIQNLFQKWMNLLGWIVETGGAYIHE
jgi:hypothetical protein